MVTCGEKKALAATGSFVWEKLEVSTLGPECTLSDETNLLELWLSTMDRGKQPFQDLEWCAAGQR